MKEAPLTEAGSSDPNDCFFRLSPFFWQTMLVKVDQLHSLHLREPPLDDSSDDVDAVEFLGTHPDENFDLLRAT